MKTKFCLSVLLSFYPVKAGSSLRSTFIFILFSFVFLDLSSQVPQGFTYQAIATDAGHPITSAITVRITIQSDSITPVTTFWVEDHSSVTPNESGLFTLVIGKGTRISGTATLFSDIDWTVTPKFIKTEINYGGWRTMGSSRLWSVPYSLVAGELGGSVNKLEVAGKETGNDDALFEVKNKFNKTVFAVYNEGVRVYIDKGIAKSAKGGFAIGGFGTKGDGHEYLRVDPGNINMYIDDKGIAKGAKGGFAIGGFGSKAGGFFNVDAGNLTTVSSNRVLWYPLKNAFLAGNVLITDTNNVGVNSFATGYQSMAKGQYSQAMGYQSQALGDYSTAIGKNAVANSNNSFAFGDGASATKIDSYAFGAGAVASGQGSFAFGSFGRDTANFLPTTSPTNAIGDYSFSIGLGATASGTSSTAMGISSIASGDASMALGISSIASGSKSLALNLGEAVGRYSIAMGLLSKAEGDYSVAIGRGASKFHTYNIASGAYSLALCYSHVYGFYSVGIGTATVNGNYGFGMGNSVYVNGDYATAIGTLLNVDSYRAFVVGNNNVNTGSKTSWIATDPLFVVGNGLGTPSNAMTVLKNANTGIATSTPTNMLDVRGDVRITQGSVYDVWIQGGGTTTPGTARNLAMVGTNDSNGDKLYLNYSGEYSAGTVIAGALNFPDPFTRTITSARYLYVNAAGEIGGINGSSIKYKENVFDLDNYNWLFDLRPVIYNYKNSSPDDLQYGLIAEEVDKVNPLLVAYGHDKTPEGIMYEKLVVPMLKVIQDQQKHIEALEAKNKEIETLKAEIEEMKALISKIGAK